LWVQGRALAYLRPSLAPPQPLGLQPYRRLLTRGQSEAHPVLRRRRVIAGLGGVLSNPSEVDDLTHAGILRPVTARSQGEDAMGVGTTLNAADGHVLAAYRAGPGTAARGLVVVQEIFGVNRHMRRVCDDLAADGFDVVAPALFDRVEREIELGYAAADVARGRDLRAQVPEAGVMADIEAAVAALGDRPSGIIGYCWGGTVAWWGATRTGRFRAAVGWYGGGIAATRTEVPRCPVQLHFGAQDGSIPLNDVELIRAAQPAVEVFVYPGAGHGFGCEERASYSASDADAARQRSLTFLECQLGG
jgi:carboxymethylenebutenolidase